jgi:hypothetical protein
MQRPQYPDRIEKVFKHDPVGASQLVLRAFTLGSQGATTIAASSALELALRRRQ